MSHRLERLLVWLLATATGAGMLYGAFTAPADTASPLLGVLIVLGVAVAAIGLIGFALEVVQWINKALPDAPSVPIYQQVIDSPAPPTSVAPVHPASTLASERSLAPKPVVTSTKARTFVDTTPQYLMGFYNNHLAIQASKLVAPYLGHWLRVSGKLGNISGDTKESSLLMVTFRRESMAASGVFMFFESKWRDRLEVLQNDQVIVVIGKITDVSALGVTLHDCELLET